MSNTNLVRKSDNLGACPKNSPGKNRTTKVQPLLFCILIVFERFSGDLGSSLWNATLGGLETVKCEEKLQSLSAIGEQLQTQLVAKLESFNKNQD